jgi:4a-hydroxytetrahydrobiopterin dehydratase
MNDLTKRRCIPCEGGVDPFDKDTAHVYLKDTPKWIMSDDATKIHREFVFRNFDEAIQFVNAVAELAESEGHHPDILIEWNKVTLTNSTHAIKGLSENDFILAAKINQVAESGF